MLRRALATAALVVAVAAPAHAQTPFRLGLAVGPTFPTGDLGDGNEWGFHATASLGMRPLLSPIGIRAELGYSDVGGKGSASTSSDLRVLSGIVNAELGLGGLGVKPYLIGGLGIYNTKRDFENRDSETDFGLNAGVGAAFDLVGFGAFAEARFHRIFVGDDADGNTVNTSFIPVSFGIRF